MEPICASFSLCVPLCNNPRLNENCINCIFLLLDVLVDFLFRNVFVVGDNARIKIVSNFSTMSFLSRLKRAGGGREKTTCQQRNFSFSEQRRSKSCCIEKIILNDMRLQVRISADVKMLPSELSVREKQSLN